MKRMLAHLAALSACVMALVLAACSGGTTSTTSSPTQLSWEGEGHSGTYTTTFENLSAGDPITVDYDITAGTVTIELSQDGVTPYAWNEESGDHSEVLFVGADGNWEAKVTLANATGSVDVKVEQASQGTSDTNAGHTAPQESPEASVANPLQGVTSLDALAETAGFPVSFPAELPGYGAPQSIQAIPDQLAQVSYGTDDDEALVRKGLGTGTEVSGDYSAYAYTTTVAVANHEVTLYGDEANDIELATWEADGYGFSISVDDDISEEAMTALVALIS